ncbi:MAG: GDSL-type esterase/lipase family protein [Armatimonadota bacterium]
MAQEFVWNDGERVMFLGDSTTDDPQGYARLAPTMVTARYPERKIDYVIHGVGGDRITEVLGRLDGYFLNEPRPTWILVSLGINDVWHDSTGTPLGRFTDLYIELMQRLKETRAVVVALTTTVIGEELDNEQNQALVGYNDAIRRIAFQFGAEVVDMNAAFHEAIRRAQAANPDFRFTTDGVHLDAYGGYLMTFTLLNALHFSLAEPAGGSATGYSAAA